MYYFLIAFAAIIAFITALLCINISINMIYCTNPRKSRGSQNEVTADLRIYVRYAFFKFYLFPERVEKKEKKRKPKIDKEVTKIEKTVAKVKKDLMTGEYKLSEIIEIIKQIADILIKNFQKYLKLKIKSFIITVATEDAQQTALTYGSVTQAVYYLYEFLNCHFKLACDDIKVYSDFGKTKMSYDINIKFSIRVWHALKMILLTVIKYQNIDKNNDEL